MITPAGLPDVTEYSARVLGRLRELADDLAEPMRSPVHELAGRAGKGLRPMLLRACADFGTPDPIRLVRLGALVELLHLASLLHDDIIDRATMRRDGPAAHTVVGTELAMLAGLGCFALAGAEAARIGVERPISRTVAGMAYGELLDVERAFDIHLSPSDYLELVERKTGALFRLSCLLGAAEAGIEPSAAQALAAFGLHFGVAFQILDDCLDLDAAGTGKPAGTDHALGLFGAPTLHALTSDNSGELSSLLLSPAFCVSDMPKVRSLVADRGGLAAAKQLAEERYDHALSHLAQLPDGRPREELAEATRLAWRDRK